MPYSYTTYTGDGSTTQYAVPFGYIRREHVLATVATVAATFTWVNDSLIQMTTPPANGAAVRVYRLTPLAAPLVDFADGATLVAADLDTNAKQSIYTQQELDDSLAGVALGAIPNGSKGDITTSVGGTVWTVNAGLSATKSTFTQAGSGATARTVDSKLKDVVSVKDFGAVGDGVTDDTAAFSTAAQAAPTNVNIVGAEGALPRAPMCKVAVPAGSYVLTSEVNTNNREVVWELDQAATISGYAFLNGEVFRVAQRQNDKHHGTTDYACTYSIRSNGDLEDGAEVLGITSASQLATYTDRDSVSLFVDNTAPAATVDVNTATYTSTTITIAAPSTTVLRQYRRGMIIDTKHSPKWSGIVDFWNADGSVITVTAWYEAGGGGTPGTPADGTGCVVNGFTKVWAHNANVTLASGSYATRASGFELGVVNNRGTLDYANQANSIWGYDAVSLGTYNGAVGFISRRSASSQFYLGFQSQDSFKAGYYVGGSPEHGFWSEQGSGNSFYASASGVRTFQVSYDGDLVIAKSFLSDGANSALLLGSPTTANTPYLDFKSSGLASSYDSRIIASGGTSTAGYGELTMVAAGGTSFAGLIRPTVDNNQSNGTASFRWSVVYAATGTINTSDERDKQDIAVLDAAEKRVATALKGLVKKFRFKDAVQAKGADARIHVGVVAQEVADAFTAEGLDATQYGLLCYDEWDAAAEVRDKEGAVFQPARIAGNRYGIRYEELLAFIIAAI
jgi:hypothetical protein